MRQAFLKWFLMFSVLAGSSCTAVKFYSQAAMGQAEILRKSRPFDEVRKDREVAASVKGRLDVVDDIRAYAKAELGLPSDRQYDRYADLGRDHVVWVVFAAPELSMEAKTWTYPFLGKLEYRGYFKEKDARRLAAELEGDGYDVYLGGVDAYSTLGVFRDPILNTFVHRHDALLAELLFHELTHQRLYLSGDTDFNEALATAVGEEGARRWLRARGRFDDLAAYERDGKSVQAFVSLAMEVREDLEVVYANESLDDEGKRHEKTRVLQGFRDRAEELNRRLGGKLRVEKWFEKPVNNARLNSLETYYEMVPAFERLLAECGGDLERFFDRLETMKRMKRDDRRRALGVAVD